MAIKRRVLPAAASFTHRIETPYFVGGITVKSERVTDAAPQLHWSIGQRYDKVREICSQRNWKLGKVDPADK